MMGGAGVNGFARAFQVQTRRTPGGHPLSVLAADTRGDMPRDGERGPKQLAEERSGGLGWLIHISAGRA